MSLEWIHENPPQWDTRKREIVDGTPDGVFDLAPFNDGDLLPGEWWRVEQAGEILGYGWMDCTWGDAEILLVVRAAKQRQGVGTFILDHLEREAAVRGLNYLHNVIRPSHPEGQAMAAWLKKRRFEAEHDSERLRRRVPVARDA